MFGEFFIDALIIIVLFQLFSCIIFWFVLVNTLICPCNLALQQNFTIHLYTMSLQLLPTITYSALQCLSTTSLYCLSPLHISAYPTMKVLHTQSQKQRKTNVPAFLASTAQKPTCKVAQTTCHVLHIPRGFWKRLPTVSSFHCSQRLPIIIHQLRNGTQCDST